jgi:hypothetical protein
MSADLPTPEISFIAALQRMFGKVDYLLPVVAAQKQYREIHYGLTAAALLEDVFTDAVAFYVKQFEPEHIFERSTRGAAEIDYLWDSNGFSHKSGLGPTDVSVLWDATVEHRATWTSQLPIAYLSTGYSPLNGTATLSDTSQLKLTSMFRKNGFPEGRVLPDGSTTNPGHGVLVVRWNADGSAEVLKSTTISAHHKDPADLFSFEEVWGLVTRETAAGRPANLIEIFRTSNRISDSAMELLKPGSSIHIDFDLRSGFYVLPQDLLSDVPLGNNNRGQLLKKAVVASLLKAAAERGLCVPMPLWYTHYAPARPPDTFLTLRAEFDSRFSSARPVG